MGDKRCDEQREKLVPKFEEWAEIEPAKAHWLAALVKLLAERDLKQIGFLVAVGVIGLIGRDLAQTGAAWAALAVSCILAAVSLAALWKGEVRSAASGEVRPDDQTQPGNR